MRELGVNCNITLHCYNDMMIFHYPWGLRQNASYAYIAISNDHSQPKSIKVAIYVIQLFSVMTS